jgi:hypothetical protein
VTWRPLSQSGERDDRVSCLCEKIPLEFNFPRTNQNTTDQQDFPTNKTELKLSAYFRRFSYVAPKKKKKKEKKRRRKDNFLRAPINLCFLGKISPNSNLKNMISSYTKDFFSLGKKRLKVARFWEKKFLIVRFL